LEAQLGLQTVMLEPRQNTLARTAIEFLEIDKTTVEFPV
jgi:hypothetical protein